jgi:L-rhamnose-H+ transport protein
VLWVLQFVCTKAGEPLMGELKYISFAVMMASTILFSTIIGVFLGEWKGASAKTKACLTLGTLVMIAGFCAISLGSK